MLFTIRRCLLSLRRDRFLTVIVIMVGLLIIARLTLLTVSPPGVYIDEVASQRHIVSMLNSWTNASGVTWPFYSASYGGGFTTPLYLYPAVVWSFFFGASELSLRVLSQVVTIVAIIITALSTRLLFDHKTGLLALVVGLALPWGWLQGSLIWDPAFVPFAASIALAGWSLLLTQKTATRRRLGSVLLPLGCVMVAYLYPPYWGAAPVLLLAAFGSLLVRERLTYRVAIAVAAASLAAVVPLALFILSPGTLGRSSALSVFHDASVFEGMGAFALNILQLINPLFLFVIGDTNLRQSTILQGMLGIGAALPLVIVITSLIRRRPADKHRRIIFSLITAFFISLIGAALTNEGQPHSLRSCAAWIFLVPIIAYGWTLLAARPRSTVFIVAVIIAVIGTLIYGIDLALFYPARSASFFTS